MSLHHPKHSGKPPRVDNLGKSCRPARVRWASLHEIGRWHKVTENLDIWGITLDAMHCGYVAIRRDDTLTLVPAPTFADVWGRA